MDALPFAGFTVLGLLLLLKRDRFVENLLASERRYGGSKMAERAGTARYQTFARRFVVVWCLGFIGIGLGGILQSL